MNRKTVEIIMQNDLEAFVLNLIV